MDDLYQARLSDKHYDLPDQKKIYGQNSPRKLILLLLRDSTSRRIHILCGRVEPCPSFFSTHKYHRRPPLMVTISADSTSNTSPHNQCIFQLMAAVMI